MAEDEFTENTVRELIAKYDKLLVGMNTSCAFEDKTEKDKIAKRILNFVEFKIQETEGTKMDELRSVLKDCRASVSGKLEVGKLEAVYQHLISICPFAPRTYDKIKIKEQPPVKKKPKPVVAFKDVEDM